MNPPKLRVLVACEFSGVVRDAFRARGHDAWSCDLLPSEKPGPHFMCDVLSPIVRPLYDRAWDLLIAHPPCTYLSRAGARWWKAPGREAKMREALAFVFALRDAPIPHICIENPIGKLNALWRRPDQTIQPRDFGHPYSKATCLWLKNLPPLLAPVASFVKADTQPWLPSNTGSGRRKGQASHPGIAHTAKDASRTFQGIADAMADQWGNLHV
jgi:hypothetical protein